MLQASVVVLVFLCLPEVFAEWKGWQDANAVFSIARAGNRLFCGMRNGDIKTWRLSGPCESASKVELVDRSAEADAEDGVQGGVGRIF